MTRAVDGGQLFRKDADNKMYLGLLQAVAERQHWNVFTFALMGNHAHLLVESTTADLSRGLWWLHWRYAEYYKARYQPRFGHVFGARPKTKPIKDDAYFLAVLRYIALNPVGAFCSRPEEYRWSAHRAILGEAAALPMLTRDEVLAWFGPGDRVSAYNAFVTGREPEQHDAIRRWATTPHEHRPALDALVADRTGASLIIAHKTWGYSLRAISRATGLGFSAVRALVAD